MAINDTPFQSQGLAGLYDRNLSAANQMAQTEAYNQANRRRSFTDLITTGITTANNAMQSEQNRKAQMELEQFQQQKLDERVYLEEQAALAAARKTKEMERQYTADDITAGSKNISDAFNNSLSADGAARVTWASTLNNFHLAQNPDAKAYYANQLKRMSGVSSDEELTPYVDGIMQPDYESPAFGFLKELKQQDLDKKKYDSLKAKQDQRKSAAEADEAENAIKKQSNIDAELDSWITEETDSNIKSFLIQSATDRENKLSSPEAAKKYEQERPSYAKNRDLTAQAIDEAFNMIQVLREAEAAGAQIGFSDEMRAVAQTLGDADAKEVDKFINDLRYQNFFVNTGSLSYTKQQELKDRYFTALGIINSRMTAIGRNLFGQTGTQTENDFSRNLQSLFTEGMGINQQILNLRKGTASLAGGNARSAIVYGDVPYARNIIGKLKKNKLAVTAEGVPILYALGDMPKEASLIQQLGSTNSVGVTQPVNVNQAQSFSALPITSRPQNTGNVQLMQDMSMQDTGLGPRNEEEQMIVDQLKERYRGR